jgi:hypothetical protein
MQVKDGNVMPASLTCPQKCNAPIDPAEIKLALPDAAARERFERLTVQRFIEQDDECCCCPTAGCSFSFAWDAHNRKLDCPLCNVSFCLVCRASPWHSGVRCEVYQTQKKAESGDVEAADKAFRTFASNSKLKQCPSCSYWVEKNNGCDAMHCRCNLVFCYRCGGVRDASGTKYKQCNCNGVAALLAAHEGAPNHNNPRGRR